jgi:hypothetical protein
MDDPAIKQNEQLLYNLIKSNLSCYHNKFLSEELIIKLSQQLTESIAYHLANATK